MIESEQHAALASSLSTSDARWLTLVREGIAEVLKKHSKSRRPARVHLVKEDRIRAATGR